MIKTIGYFFVLILTSYSSLAQSNGEKSVAAAVESLRQAMVAGDSVKLDQIAAEKLSYGHSSGVVQDKAAFIHSLASGASDFVTIDLTDQTIAITGNTAIVRHTLSATTNDNGRPGTVKIMVMTVWQQQNGDWKLLARQAIRPPQ